MGDVPSHGLFSQGSWSEASSYNLAAYGPNGFFRLFHGSTGPQAAALAIASRYNRAKRGSIESRITNVAANEAVVKVLDAYTGDSITQLLFPGQTFENVLSPHKFHGWYDLMVTVEGDQTFQYELAGHIETGEDSFSDPALGGLIALKG